MTTEAPPPAVDTQPIIVATEKKEGVQKKSRGRRSPKTPKVAPAEDGAVAEQTTQQEEEDDTHKVFVGNLAFATTEEELKTFCASAGAVVKVEIITRGTRSLGYGFVSFDTEAEATKAVELFDKQDLAGRQVNVELAKHREPGELKARAKAVRGGGRIARGAFGFRGRGRGYFGRGGFRGRGRRFTSGDRSADKRVDDEEPKTEDDASPSAEGDATEESTRARGGRGRGRYAGRRRFPRGGRGAKSPTEKVEKAEPTGELSKTVLFVANLPFKVSDEDLKAIFKDYKVVNAHVVRLRSGRSKGFGFVEVESHDEQQKVLELKQIVVDDRELVVKVALANQTPPVKEDAPAPAAEEATA